MLGFLFVMCSSVLRSELKTNLLQEKDENVELMFIYKSNKSGFPIKINAAHCLNSGYSVRTSRCAC